MANITSGDIWELRIFATVGDQLSINRLHYRAENLVGTVTDVEALQQLETSLNPSFRNLISNNATYEGMIFQRAFPKPRTYPVTDQGGAGPGSQVDTVLPKQICGVLTKETDFAGPKYRGRVFLPFPAESANDPTLGRPNAAYIALMDAFAGNIETTVGIVAGGGTVDLRPVLLHPDGTYHNITNIRSRPYWATQRRRSDYGAQNQSPI